MPAMEWLLQHESDADIDESLVLGARAGRTRRKRKEFVPNPRVSCTIFKITCNIMELVVPFVLFVSHKTKKVHCMCVQGVGTQV